MTFNVVEAAEYCKCHPETIREHIREGRLKASKPGRSYCITQTALDEFLHEFGMKLLFVGLKKNRRRKVLRTILQNCEGLKSFAGFICIILIAT